MKLFAKLLSAFDNLSIAWRLVLCITAGAATIMGIILGGSYYFIEKKFSESVTKYVYSTAQDIAAQAGEYLAKIEATNRVLALNIEKNIADEAKINSLLKEQLASNDVIFGVCLAYEPVIINGVKIVPDTVYAYYSSEKMDILHENPYSEDYYARNNVNLYERDWYKKGKENSIYKWSEPYYYVSPSGVSTKMITCSSPIFQNGKLIGVVGTDISLKWFAGGLGSWILNEISYSFIVSPQGNFLVNTLKEFEDCRTIYEFAQASGNETLMQTVENMAVKRSGFVELENLINGKSTWFIYLPIAKSDWTLGIFIPMYYFLEIARVLIRLQLILSAVSFVLLITVISLLVRSITGPLRELNHSLENISKDINAELPVFPGNNEVAVLARSYKTMIGELKINMQTLAKTTAAKEKIESELRIASAIQMSLLPKEIPDFSQKNKCEIHAVLKPAKEVGGDFYDYFLLDEEHLCLVIGDVSGKGVPAAIFVAVARTLVQAFAKNIRTPSQLLHAVNNELIKNNDNYMFITLFCVFIHLPSGQCRFANGGHNLPMIIEHCAHSPAKVTKLPLIKGYLLGIIESDEKSFGEGVFTLRPNTTLLLYTDGITEAENADGLFYGVERLEQTLATCCDNGGDSLIQSLLQDVSSFVAQYEQSDDITVVSFNYHKNSNI